MVVVLQGLLQSALKTFYNAITSRGYGDILMGQRPRILVKGENRWDSNCRPCSAIRILGTSNLATQCITNVQAKISAVMPYIRIASGQRENELNRYIHKMEVKVQHVKMDMLEFL